jgi:hypothetical protein
VGYKYEILPSFYQDTLHVFKDTDTNWNKWNNVS